MLPKYFLGLATPLTTTFRIPLTKIVSTLELMVKLSTDVRAEFDKTRVLPFSCKSEGTVIVNILALVEERVTEGSATEKVVAEANVVTEFRMVRGEVLIQRERGVDPLPME